MIPRSILAVLSAALIVTAAAAAGGCSTPQAAIAWSGEVAGQPLEFRVDRDSADVAWSRAERWLRENAAPRELSVVGDRIETRPEPQSINQRWYAVERSVDGDSVRIFVHFDVAVRQPADALAELDAETAARQLARYIERGETYDGFASRYAPDSAGRSAAEALEQQRPTRAWGSFGGGPYGFAFEVGVRRDWWGVSYGAADFDGRYDPVPGFDSTSAPPDGTYTTERFAGLFSGVNLYGFLDLSREVSLYGAAGLYARVDTELERHDASGAYYQRGSGTVWSNPALSLAAGVQLSLAGRLVLGAGYGSVTGAHAQLGWRW